MSTSDRAPLGEPNEGYANLPSAWRVAVSTCPHCVSGTLAQKEDCKPCGGSGDLLGAMLVDAFRRGVQHTLSGMREVEAVRKAQVTKVLEEEPSQRQLRSAMGMGQ